MDKNAPDFEELIFRGVESDELDYKAHQNWHTLSHAGRCKLVRHLTAFANTKGGYLVIGIGEDASGCPTVRTGLTDEEAASFDPTPVGTFVNQCVEPPIQFTLERPVVRGRRYAVFLISPFSTLPHICTRSAEDELQQGVFYIRTPEASSRAAHRAYELQNLIQRAMRNERKSLERMLRGILNDYSQHGGETVPDGESVFQDMRTESERYFERRRPCTPERPLLLQFSATPGTYRPGTFQEKQMLRAVQNAWQFRKRPDFIGRDETARLVRTSDSLRMLAEQNPRMWQLFDSGLFHYISYCPLPGGALGACDTIRLCTEALAFFGKLYAELGWQEEQLTVQLLLNAPADLSLNGPGAGERHSARRRELAVSVCRSAGDLSANWEKHAEDFCRRLGEAFHLPDHSLALFPELVRRACREELP